MNQLQSYLIDYIKPEIRQIWLDLQETNSDAKKQEILSNLDSHIMAKILHIDSTLMSAKRISEKCDTTKNNEFPMAIVAHIKSKNFDMVMDELSKLSHTTMATMHPDFPMSMEYIKASKRLANSLTSGDDIKKAMIDLHNANLCEFKTFDMDMQAEQLALYDSWYADGRREFMNGLLAALKNFGHEVMSSFDKVEKFQNTCCIMIKTGNWLSDKDGKPNSTAKENRNSYKIHKAAVIRRQLQALERVKYKISDFNTVLSTLNDLINLMTQYCKNLEASNLQRSCCEQTVLETQHLELQEIIKLQNAVISDEHIEGIESNFELLKSNNTLAEIAVLFANIRIGYDFEFRPRQEASMHSVAIAEFINAVGVYIPDFFKGQGEVHYLELSPSDKIDLIEYIVSDAGKQLFYEMKFRFYDDEFIQNNKIAAQEVNNFIFYRDFGTETLQLAQYQGVYNYLEVFLLQLLAGDDRVFQMEISILPENPEYYGKIINHPEEYFVDLVDNPLINKYFAYHGRFRMLFPSSDSSRLGHITASISRYLMRDKLKNFFAKLNIDIRFDDGGGLQDARGGVGILLDSCDATNQNGMLYNLGLNPYYLADIMGAIFLKQLRSDIKPHQENYKYDELLINLAKIGVNKKVKLRSSTAFDYYITKSGLADILSIFKLHRAERHSDDIVNDVSKLDLLDKLTINDIKNAKSFTGYRAITDDFAQFMLESNKWFELANSIKEAGFTKNNGQLDFELIRNVANYSKVFKQMLQKISAAFNYSDTNLHWLLIDEDMRPKSYKQLEKWATTAEMEFGQQSIVEQDVMHSKEVRNVMALFTRWHNIDSRKFHEILDEIELSPVLQPEDERKAAYIANYSLATIARKFRKNIFVGQGNPLTTATDGIDNAVLMLASARNIILSTQQSFHKRYLNDIKTKLL